MEIWKGYQGNLVKFYESDLWVNDFNRSFQLKFTDAELCNCDPDMPLQIKFISRNQYKMENDETCRLETCLTELVATIGKDLPLKTATGL